MIINSLGPLCKQALLVINAAELTRSSEEDKKFLNISPDFESTCSRGFRNLERGVQLLAREARPKIFGLPRPLPVTLAVSADYLEATLSRPSREISKELIRERVTVPGCCCCIII